MKRYSLEELNWLKANYPKYGTAYCCKQLNRSKASIRQTANKLGARLTQNRMNEIHSESFTKNYQLGVPLDAFSVNCSPESAYVLGLLWADGWTTFGKSFSIDIKLVKEDMDELLWIFKRVGVWKIYNYKPKNRKEVTQLRASGRGLVEYLISIGYDRKSSESAKLVIDTIPDNLKKYWWRGYLDGDGHISKSLYRVEFSSSVNQDWSFLPSGFSISRTYGKHSYSKARICNRIGVKNLLSYIYANIDEDKIGLTRKYMSAKRILSA